MEEECRRVAREEGLEVVVVGDEELEGQGLRLLKAVGQASVNKPRLVNLTYKGDEGSEDWVAFVGKGLCFDSGGLSIKTTSIFTNIQTACSGCTWTNTAPAPSSRPSEQYPSSS